MTANARNMRPAPSSLPTLDDVASGKITLDEYEIAHGEDAPEWTEADFKRARPISDFPHLQALHESAAKRPWPAEEPVTVAAPVAVRFETKTLTISLADGRELTMPITWYPDLVDASSEERAAFVLTPTSVQWPALLEEARIADILRIQLRIQALQRARGQRGPQKAPVKDRVGLRLDHDVVEHFRATGPGWQSRINDILAEYVRRAKT